MDFSFRRDNLVQNLIDTLSAPRLGRVVETDRNQTITRSILTEFLSSQLMICSLRKCVTDNIV